MLSCCEATTSLLLSCDSNCAPQQKKSIEDKKRLKTEVKRRLNFHMEHGTDFPSNYIIPLLAITSGLLLDPPKIGQVKDGWWAGSCLVTRHRTPTSRLRIY